MQSGGDEALEILLCPRPAVVDLVARHIDGVGGGDRAAAAVRLLRELGDLAVDAVLTDLPVEAFGTTEAVSPMSAAGRDVVANAASSPHVAGKIWGEALAMSIRGELGLGPLVIEAWAYRREREILAFTVRSRRGASRSCALIAEGVTSFGYDEASVIDMAEALRILATVSASLGCAVSLCQPPEE